ncbi:MAG: thioredoxin family protein [Acidobacteriota bacterium]
MLTAAKTGRRIIVDIGGEWCGWCIYLDKYFFQNPELAKIRDNNFVWIKVNFSEENENTAFLAPYPEPKGYPHLYVLDAGGKLIQSQDTSELVAPNGYDLAKFTDFLERWSPTAAGDAH